MSDSRWLHFVLFVSLFSHLLQKKTNQTGTTFVVKAARREWLAMMMMYLFTFFVMGDVHTARVNECLWLLCENMISH